MQRRLPKVGFRSKLEATPPKCCSTSSTSSTVARDRLRRAARRQAGSDAAPSSAKIVKKGEMSKKFVLKGVARYGRRQGRDRSAPAASVE